MSISRVKRILVTGCGGFVGGHMIDACLERGIRVTALDNFSSSSKERFVERFGKKVYLVEGDVRDLKSVTHAATGADAVFHFAAIRSVAKTVEDPFLAHEVNATGALVLLEAAHKCGAKHFVFTSTSAVYGSAVAKLQREDGALAPISPYGVAKLAAENYARYYFTEKGLPTTSVRIFNVYGPRQNPESKYSLVVPGVLSKIHKLEAPVVDGTGRQERDFVYIGDVIGAFFKILGNSKSYGKVYNLGAGRAVSINEIVKTLLKLSGSKLKPVHGPARPGDPPRTCAAVSLIRRELGWKPAVDVDEGLKRVVEWAKTEKNAF